MSVIYRPLVGVIACRREIEGHPAHMATDKYLTALRDYGLAPVVLPVWEEADVSLITAWLERLDGLMLTGSPTNVDPSRYGEARAPENERSDTDRDAVALGLIPAVLERGLPFLAICRGFQELNVSRGGSLYQTVQKVPGKFDHRESKEEDKAVRYGPSHELDIVPEGELARLFSGVSQGGEGPRVNSLHQQGIHELGQGLRIEARAPDGLIEAVSVEDAANFALAVQWHPEWFPKEHPLYDAIFRGFAEACTNHVKG
ncbi:gamma-glutamyl-gamma-aminobutyrate hydrolase family protein [Pistricoccus aurantiacus]|uniref:gamma-glutamyl-gamma-aminobutyrate hydrolase family protein n=1 Tax=Pistricoccus aurantiacus TaxID=1883414 RepID=UPI0036253823